MSKIPKNKTYLIYDYRFGDYRNIIIDAFKEKFPFCIEQVGTDYCKDNYILERKNSPLTVVGYTFEGEGILIEDEKKYFVCKNDFFILKNGHNHKYYPHNSWAFKWINIYGDFEKILKANEIDNVIVFKCNPLIEKFEKTITDAINANQGIEAAQIETQSFINSMLPYIKMSSFHNFDETLTIEEKIKTALEKVCFRDYSFEDICKDIGITTRHAQRLFKQKFSMTPHNYVLQLRYKQACSLLMMPNLSITYIANQVGFIDPKYFSAFFKSYSGYSPQRYRKFIKKIILD